jgi:subtilisin family serine protease
MQQEEKAMTCMRRIRTMACVLVAVTLMVTLLSGGAFGASADNLRKIVMFYNPPNPLVFVGTGIQVLHNLSLINALAVQLPALGTNAALAFLQNLINQGVLQGVYDDVVGLVDPVCPTTALPPGKESYPWGQAQIVVPDVHRQHPEVLQTLGVTVAVMDTGIDPTHPEFSQRIALGYNARPGGGSSADDHGHGTHMAGIIAAALDGLGIIGAAPKAILVPVKVLDRDGTGYTSDVINGLQWIQENGIPLVNMSFGFSTPSTPLRQAIQSLNQGGIIMVASVGNRCAAAPTQDDGGGDDCKGGPAAVCDAPRTAVMYPAAYPGVIGVGATNIDDEITEYSLEGNEVDVAAPGGEQTSGAQPGGRILSTNKGGGYGLGYGTSQAAAHVTGAVALALQLHPGLSIAEVTNLLRTTAVNLIDPTTNKSYPATQQGAGQINVLDMIEELLP